MRASRSHDLVTIVTQWRFSLHNYRNSVIVARCFNIEVWLAFIESLHKKACPSYCCYPPYLRATWTMVNSCCIVGCTNRAKPGSDIIIQCNSSDYATPRWKDKAIFAKETWFMDFTNWQGWIPTANSRVCSIHFHKGTPTLRLITVNHVYKSFVQESLPVCMTQQTPTGHLACI